MRRALRTRPWAIALCCSALLACGYAEAASAGAEPQGDARRGERVYGVCLACHAMQNDSAGPRHCGVFGRKAGSVPGFDYSPAMKRSGLTWNEKTLEAFLQNPMKLIPGTSMVFAGVGDARDRADVIAYLEAAPKCAK
jgi:cytochrome c